MIFAVGLVATFAVFALLGTYNAYVWWCTTSTFFAMITFLFGNLAANILNRHRLRTIGGVVLFGLVPSVGIVCDVYILAQSFFIEPCAQPWATGKSVVVFAVACALSASALLASKHRSQKKVRSIWGAVTRYRNCTVMASRSGKGRSF